MTPYTYLIGWRHLKKYYYGVRFSKNSDPKELWVDYFTSSKYVLDLYNEYGNPDVIEIRRIFESSDKARKWENKVLKRIGAVKRNDFINKTDNFSISTLCSSREGDKWINNGHKEKLLSLNEKMPQGWVLGRIPHGRKPSKNFTHNKPHTKETKELISKKKRGKRINRSNVDVSGKNNPMWGKIWITNDTINKTINKFDQVPEGYRRGKVQNGR
jgi:hypothetical protein